MTTLETLLADPETVGAWTLDPGRSTIGFKCRTFWGLQWVTGTFTQFFGDAQITAAGEVFGHVAIAAASLATGMGKRDEHLRSADFFEVDRYPEITVAVTGLAPTTGNNADVRATMTIKDTTEPLPLPVTIHILDDGAVRVLGTTKIDRRTWDVTGDLIGMVSMSATLTADAVFTRTRD
jgi:polyisoprenoid-binding protein YceI